MIGASFEGSSLMSVGFTDCQMDYCNFSNTKAQQLMMQRCAMSENAFVSFKWKEWQVDGCRMHRCEFSDTPMKGMDVSTCEIGSWLIDLYSLRGLKVTQEQALIFAGLLGLQITDQPS